MAAQTGTNQGGNQVVMQGISNQGGIPVMIQGAPTQMNQQQFFCAPGNQKQFPVRSLRIFGGIQIVLGILLGLLSIIGVGLDAVAMNTDCSKYQYPYDMYGSSYNEYWRCWRSGNTYHALFAFDITCLVCSGWYIMTGILPVCMSKKRENSWRGLRIGFMVCSIIGAAVFVPTMFSLGVVGSILRADYSYRTTVLSAFMAVVSFIELVVAIVAASFCCCCTPWRNQQQTGQIIIMSASQPGMFTNLPQTQMPVMNYQPMTTVGGQGMPQDPRAQQYFISTNQQQFQPNMNNQSVQTPAATGGTSGSEAPPAYKE